MFTVSFDGKPTAAAALHSASPTTAPPPGLRRAAPPPSSSFILLSQDQAPPFDLLMAAASPKLRSHCAHSGKHSAHQHVPPALHQRPRHAMSRAAVIPYFASSATLSFSSILPTRTPILQIKTQHRLCLHPFESDGPPSARQLHPICSKDCRPWRPIVPHAIGWPTSAPSILFCFKHLTNRDSGS